MLLARLRETTADEEQALAFALEALRHAVGRHRDVQPADENFQAAYASMVEATWWIAALDEQLKNEYHGESYTSQRDRHEDGQLVLGFLWARDRHTHQVSLSVDRGRTTFFGGPGVIHINKGFSWRPAAHLGDGQRRPPEWKGTYERSIAGWASWKPLALCVRWFDEVARAPNSVLHLASDRR